MARSGDRVEARRMVQQAQAHRRQQQRARDKQLERLAVEVQLQLLQGRQARQAHEVAAGRALNQMAGALGAGIGEVIDWCCGELTPREVARLRSLADEQDAAAGEAAAGEA